MPAASSFRKPRRLLAAVAMLAVALIAPSPAAAQGCANADANPNHIPLDAAEQATLCLLNAERRARGLRPLRENARLTAASQRHARAMVAGRYFAHGNFVGRIRSARYLSGARSWTVGENIAWGSQDYASPRMTMRGWMNSPPHRRNILSGRFREVGVGVVRGSPRAGMRDAATYVTDFGARR